MKNPFTNKIARQIAIKSFSHTLDCILGYSDSGYTLKTDTSEFEQNFEEDLEEMNIQITPRRILVCSKYYNKLIESFEKSIRRKYYK